MDTAISADPACESKVSDSRVQHCERASALAVARQGWSFSSGSAGGVPGPGSPGRGRREGGGRWRDLRLTLGTLTSSRELQNGQKCMSVHPLRVPPLMFCSICAKTCRPKVPQSGLNCTILMRILQFSLVAPSRLNATKRCQKSSKTRPWGYQRVPKWSQVGPSGPPRVPKMYPHLQKGRLWPHPGTPTRAHVSSGSHF